MRRELTDATKLLLRDETVLVLIDVQEKLVAAASQREALVGNLVRLATFASTIGLPVVLTEQDKMGPTIEPVRQALPGTVQPIEKIHFNAVENLDFERALRRLKKQTVILAGVEAHICVTQTALSLLNNYMVQVVADAVASRSDHNRALAMDRLKQGGVSITSTEMAIYELLGKAGSGEFRAILPLIKQDEPRFLY